MMKNSKQATYLPLQIGGKIKQIRKDKGLKLGELADQAGMSNAMVSKIENGRMFPTLPSLLQLLQALGTGLSDFFVDMHTEEGFPGYIFRKASDYQPMQKEEAVGFHYQSILTHTIEKSSLEISILTLSPKAQREKVSTAGLEYIFMVKGQLTFELGEEKFEMEEGDSLLFDGNIPHVPRNEGTTDAVMFLLYFIHL